MIVKLSLLCCEEEHGTGDVFFPDDLGQATLDMKHYGSMGSLSAAELRRAARKIGWTRQDRRDLCPLCSGNEDTEFGVQEEHAR